MKKIIILFGFIFLSLSLHAQYMGEYTEGDNEYGVCLDVNNLLGWEINQYFHQYIEKGVEDDLILFRVNQSRSYGNLRLAPSLLLNAVLVFDVDSLWFLPINTRPSDIKELVINVEFYDDDNNLLYDLKNGRSTEEFILRNINGRGNPKTWESVFETMNGRVFKIMRGFTCKSYFYNKKKSKIKIKNIKAKYIDGKIETKWYSVKSYQMYGDTFDIHEFVKNSPFSPEYRCFKHITNNKTFQTPEVSNDKEVSRKVWKEPKNPIIEPKVEGLEGYRLLSFPISAYTFSQTIYRVSYSRSVAGTVVVRVVVSPHGDVTNASIVGGTITDTTICKACLILAKQARFTPPRERTIERSGTFTYTIGEEVEEVSHSATVMPLFPGGCSALMRYLYYHTQYPKAAQDNNIQGKVVVQFVVEKDGSVGEVKVARSVDKELDAEAIRVCKTLPKFSPGRNAIGEPVRVWYTLPISFKLQGTS